MEDTPQPEELQLGDSFAQILTETTQSLVCVLDREGRIRLFNEACERATGYTRAEVLGRPAQDFVIPSEEREAFSEFLAFVWRTGTLEPAGRALAHEGRRPPADRVVEPVDGRHGPGHHGHRSDRPRVQPRRRAGGRPGGEAGRGQPRGERAQGAAAGGDARRVGGLAGADLRLGVGGGRARAPGQRHRRRALRRRRHGRDGRPSQPRQRRRDAARHAPAARRRLRARPGGAHRRARPDRRLGRRQRRGALPLRLPLHRRGPDHGHRRAVGRGRDRERATAAAGHREPPGRLRRARVARRRLRAGAHGPDRLPRPAREGR